MKIYPISKTTERQHGIWTFSARQTQVLIPGLPFLSFVSLGKVCLPDWAYGLLCKMEIKPIPCRAILKLNMVPLTERQIQSYMNSGYFLMISTTPPYTFVTVERLCESLMRLYRCHCQINKVKCLHVTREDTWRKRCSRVENSRPEIRLARHQNWVISASFSLSIQYRQSWSSTQHNVKTK